MRYDVHIFTVVRVKVVGVEAGSHEEAMQKADDQVDFNRLFSRIPGVEWAEEHSHALVDDHGDTEYENSRWYDADLKTLMGIEQHIMEAPEDKLPLYIGKPLSDRALAILKARLEGREMTLKEYFNI